MSGRCYQGGSALLLYVAIIVFFLANLGAPRLFAENEAADQENPSSGYRHRAFPVVEPDSGHTKLMLAKTGLDIFSNVMTPVAIVSVIGPYRSGKSFLLNQLLSLSCDEGFGVGHLRDTKTRGIWVWGEPKEIYIDEVKTSVFFLDTEGFESIGKSNVYDDRIFALAAILSSVLIYNLPETVREADIGKLSFAVELAEEFFGRVKGHENTLEPARLLWLIQRDFLEGNSVQQMVSEALQPVPNPHGIKDIDQVNRIRDSLALMAENSSAFSLPQPHLQRTKLCEMADAELDQEYVQRRDRLKEIVLSLVKPKVVQGMPLTGKDFALLLKQTLEALNKGDIPTAGSVVDTFNHAVVDQCIKFYDNEVSKIKLPISEDIMFKLHEDATKAASAIFDQQRFGRNRGGEAEHTLANKISKTFAALKAANEYKSMKHCERLYSDCEDRMDELQNLRLPSMGKFDAGFSQCNKSYEQQCFGPSKVVYQGRLQKMLMRERSQFIDNYNQRLFNWLIVFSLLMVVVGRFFIKFFLLEVAAWVLFIVLETYTRIFWSAESLYTNPIWQIIISIWEIFIYSPFLDVDRWAVPLAWLFLSTFVMFRCWRRRRRRLHLLPNAENSRHPALCMRRLL
ncbi:hypothetical protein O6H91_04G029100 [Diphasiastrum complanatum]|uniref:Uncharacterized protein n=2 Tax=Diphasiastrum complanatum TaxID=34168 RepID=A0ACC2DVQ6_DIPCM|nr:hypothetical protein O6H91_04G029100 [Diphasiastrum complanatum]